MKIRLRILTLVCALIFSLSGCAVLSSNNNSSPEQEKNPNETISIYDKDETFITDIEHFGSITQTDDGFIYSKLASNSTNKVYVMEYFHYIFSTDEHKKLGTIENWVYEATYDSFCKNNHIYMLITTGNPYNFNETENYLYDMDLLNNTMTGFMLENATSPYNSMTFVNDKIFIATPGRKMCFVSSYDIGDKSISELREYYFDPDTNSGETIRHISSDEQYIYLLRLYMEGEHHAKMYIDVFDLNLTQISSIDVTTEITANTLESEDKNMELRQLVSHFDVNNNFVYYENFSITRALFEIQNINLIDTDHVQSKQVFEASPALYKALNASSNKELSIFYEAYQNKIFVLNTVTRQISENSFFVKGLNYRITYMTYDSQGNALLFLDYIDPGSFETMPQKIYYVNISEIRDSIENPMDSSDVNKSIER